MNNRIRLIQDLLRSRKIRSQGELARLLSSQGIRVTQATLSRDLKKMQVIKLHDPAVGGYYTLPEPDRQSQPVRSLAFSGQMGIIKTLPGCASMIGAIIDGHSHPSLMGTIAGDDTLLLILTENTDFKVLSTFLKSIIPGLGGIVPAGTGNQA